MQLRHGPGTYADPDAKPERWGGRKAQEYVARTLADYGDVCIICGLRGSDSADHVIPRAEGGAVYDLANLGPAHRRCNYARGKRPLMPVGIPIEDGMEFMRLGTDRAYVIDTPTPDRVVVLLCGPPGAGKSTAARQSGLEVYDRDDEQWTDRSFGAALDRLASNPHARAVVIRHGATSSARAKVRRQIGATHAFILTAPRDELQRRIRARRRADLLGTIAGVDHWLNDHDRDDHTPTFTGWGFLAPT